MNTPQAHSSTDPRQARLEQARQRLQRLEAFLREDPDNQPLLIDAFECALACGEWSRAHAWLQRGLAQPAQALGWCLREGDYWLAQQRYDEARTALERIQAPDAPADFQLALRHNLAFIDFRQTRWADCIARIAPAVEPPNGALPLSTAARALQLLWLRALHHARDYDRALAWAGEAERGSRLDGVVGGAAALIAVDAAAFDLAQRWASLAPPQEQVPEGLVALSSLALAAKDPERARQFADAALAAHPREGRAWSARAFADLLAGDLAKAQRAFAQALAFMPAHIGTWHGQGWAALLAGDLATAERSFAQALVIDRNFAESHGGLAVVLVFQQRKDEAAEHVEHSLRLDRTSLSGRYAQALLRGDAQSPDDLQRLARRLLAGKAAPLGGSLDDWLPGVDGKTGGAASSDGA